MFKTIIKIKMGNIQLKFKVKNRNQYPKINKKLKIFWIKLRGVNNLNLRV